MQGLVVRGAVMHQRDAVAIDAVQRDHLFHSGSSELFHDRSARRQHFEAGFRGHGVSVLPFPLSRQGLQPFKGGFRPGSREQRKNQGSQEQENDGERNESAAGPDKTSSGQFFTPFEKWQLGHTPAALFDGTRTE